MNSTNLHTAPTNKPIIVATTPKATNALASLAPPEIRSPADELPHRDRVSTGLALGLTVVGTGFFLAMKVLIDKSRELIDANYRIISNEVSSCLSHITRNKEKLDAAGDNIATKAARLIHEQTESSLTSLLSITQGTTFPVIQRTTTNFLLPLLTPLTAKNLEKYFLSTDAIKRPSTTSITATTDALSELTAMSDELLEWQKAVTDPNGHNRISSAHQEILDILLDLSTTLPAPTPTTPSMVEPLGELSALVHSFKKAEAATGNYRNASILARSVILTLTHRCHRGAIKADIASPLRSIAMSLEEIKKLSKGKMSAEEELVVGQRAAGLFFVLTQFGISTENVIAAKEAIDSTYSHTNNAEEAIKFIAHRSWRSGPVKG